MIEWAEPTTKSVRGRVAKYAESLRELQEHPNNWGIIARSEKSNVSSYVHKWKKAPSYSEFDLENDFEFTSREKGLILYGRYVGDNDVAEGDVLVKEVVEVDEVETAEIDDDVFTEADMDKIQELISREIGDDLLS